MTDSFDMLRSFMKDILQVPEEAITRDTKQSDLEAWDSLEHLNLMLALEQEFDLTLDVDDLQNLTSVAAILRHLESA